MHSLLRDLRYAVRTLRRAPGFAISITIALALGTGLGIALGSFLRRATMRSLLYTDRGASARIAEGDWRAGWSDGVQSIAGIQDAGIEALLGVLFGTTLLALGIVGINLIALLLARATWRRQEMAMRAALGARRRRLARQLLTEGALLCLLGGGAGLLLGMGGTVLLRVSWPNATPPWDRLGTDALALGIVVGTLTLTTLFFALAPMTGALRKNLHAALTATGRATAGRGEGWVRNALVIVQISASLMLLTSAGLLLRSFVPQQGTNDPGIDPGNTLTVQLDLSAPRYAKGGGRAEIYEEILERVGSLPGVRAESIASTGAWVGLGSEDLVRTVCPECRVGMMILPINEGPARHHVVSPEFFDTLGVEVLRGRGFHRSGVADGAGAAADTEASVGEVVINEVFAYRLFPNGDPLGKQLQVGGFDGDWYTVVGIVENIRPHGIGNGAEPAPALYLSALRHPPRLAGLAVRTVTDPADLVPAVEAAIHAADEEQTPFGIMTMEERLAGFVAPLGWFAWTFGVLAGAATLLAVVGLYGVMSYNVERRTREIGIRMALGAGGGRTVRLIVGQSMRLVGLGGALGLIGALSLARLLQLLFHGIRPLDPVVYAGIALLLGAAALVASWRPALRAARVDPMVALRAE